MGAWGAESFENDDAADWSSGLEGADSFEVVRQALSVTEAPYVEAPDGSMAVAAAEVVAAALGRPSASLPDAVREWVVANGSMAEPGDGSAALAAVFRVRSDGSELRELWNEAGSEDWNRCLTDLSERLGFVTEGRAGR